VGYWVYQDTLVPVPLAEGVDLFVKASPEFGEDSTHLEALLPAGQQVETFLANQSDLTLLQPMPGGVWAGQLVSGLQASRHGLRWRITLRQGWRMQNGGTLDAAEVKLALRDSATGLGGDIRIIDGTTVELRFKDRPKDLMNDLAHWRMPGTGPFIRKGYTLTRFDGFICGKAGVEGVTVYTNPVLMDGHAWAEGLASGRWAWAAFPERIAAFDMVKARLVAYDEIHLKDGSVWFLSQRMRRLRPQTEDWTRTRLFGVWKGATNLPYDPLGL
jgi:hypothetical protein